MFVVRRARARADLDLQGVNPEIMRLLVVCIGTVLALPHVSSLPLPAKGSFSVCTGSVCTRYGADLVLESAQALACGSSTFTVRAAGCLNACKSRDHTAVAVYCGKKAVIGACADDAKLAAATTSAELVDAGVDVNLALMHKLDGDVALADGDAEAAAAAYTEAIEAAPDGFLVAESDAATAALTEKSVKPAKLKGLPPSRRAVVVKKELERTAPGRVRWLYNALLGRGRARLALGSSADSVADAQRATALCPLDPVAWEFLAEAANASGDATLAAEAEAEAQRRRPEA